MKPTTSLPSVATLLVIAAASLLTVRPHSPAVPRPPAGARTFQVLGQIRALDHTDKTIRIAHEEIPHYMPAMTMSFAVKDPLLLGKVALGDEVQFELVVTEKDSWVSHIDKVRSTAPSAQPRAAEEAEAESLHAGEPVPDFQLTDQDGRTLHLKDFRGNIVLLTFIYTRCPLPNFCPLMSQNFAELERRLCKEFPDRFHLLSISLDPEFDQPSVLKEYAARYSANPKDWSFAATDAESLNFIAGLMGLYFEKQNGLISHDLRTALIGPDGRLVQLWKSNVWTPYEVQRRVRETLTGQPDIASR